MTSTIQSGYYEAIKQAVEIFAKNDPAQMAYLSGGEYLPTKSSMQFTYLDEVYEVNWPTGKVQKISSGEEASSSLAVLLLNYLVNANGQRATGSLIAIRDIPGAASYEGPFHKRATEPLIKKFDGGGDLLVASAKMLGGEEIQIADVAVSLPVLPLLTINYAIWHGDDEFSAAGIILFDNSVRKLLPVECLVVAAANGVYALIKSANSLRQFQKE